MANCSDGTRVVKPYAYLSSGCRMGKRAKVEKGKGGLGNRKWKGRGGGGQGKGGRGEGEMAPPHPTPPHPTHTHQIPSNR